MNLSRHEDFYGLRFLLHGIGEQYNSEEILYVAPQESSLWEKVACKVLESWRIIPSALADVVPRQLWNSLQIQAISPESIIAELSPDSITGDDLPLPEDREKLLDISENVQHIDMISL